jgi:hypothetical protein
MIQPQLMQRVDELSMDMEGRGKVEHQLDLGFSTIPSSSARTASTRTRSSLTSSSPSTRTSSPDEMGFKLSRSRLGVSPKTATMAQLMPTYRRRKLVPFPPW